MKELIGYWSFGIHGVWEVALDDGCFSMKPKYGVWEHPTRFKRDFGKRFFGDSEFLVGVTNEYIDKILADCLGKTEGDISKIADGYKRLRADRKDREAKEREKWEALKDKFDGVVIGLDKKIDVYGTGFSVRVVFSSDIPFMGKAKFLKENRIEFVRWVMKEISESKKIMGRIGDIKFYKPVEIINLRAREVEVKFEVKEDNR